jgi:D-alanine-D-alanine ligase
MKILVLGGGNSPERDVSLRSAQAVDEGLLAAGFETIRVDPAVNPGWHKAITADMVFPILHGAGGEDGSLQRILEKSGVPFLGSGSKASERAWDKWGSMQIFSDQGISRPAGRLLKSGARSAADLPADPYVLKVVNGGSSIGVVLVRDPAQPPWAQIQDLLSSNQDLIVEELVDGQEITVGVLGDMALPLVEIHPPAGAEFDYQNKYNGASREVSPPESISEQTQTNAREIAEKLHRAVGCRHLSRTDMIVTNDGRVVAFDINTMPGLSPQSLFPKAALAAGMDMPRLVSKMVDLVKRDYSL